MNKEKISSQEIIDQVAAKLSISKRVAEDFIKNMFSSIEESLMDGDAAKIKNFGTFKLQWNESRKSVNVNTGEEILLNGYYKITFTPDELLKVIVNEPFAHLSPVVLDNITTTIHQLSDPLKALNDQAAEIKSILSEINSSVNYNLEINELVVESNLSNENGEDVENQKDQKVESLNSNTVDNSEKNQFENAENELDVNDRVLEELIEINEIPVNIITTTIPEDNKPTVVIADKDAEEPVDKEENKIVEILQSKVDEAEFSTKNTNAKRAGLWIILLLFFVTGGLLTLYFYNLSFYAWINDNVLSNNAITNRLGVNENPDLLSDSMIASNASDTTVKISVDTVAALDMYDILFENARKYEDIITVDRVRSSNSLTDLSKRFYGHKDFWVYIYEANKDTNQDTANIKSGTLIKIPKLDERLTDIQHLRSFELATKLYHLLFKKQTETNEVKTNETNQVTETNKVSKTVEENKTVKPVAAIDEKLIAKPVTYIATVRFEPGDRLTTFAKKYYGHKDFWIYIFEANKEAVKNPDNIHVGTIIKIPKLDPTLIDASNPACLSKAREMHQLYLKKNRE
ncbi:MAG: HU family DNA-binding protein [Paludibacter sp.]|nr:HU family DNA-binding protein [Paludibacter sp.]